MSHIIQAAELAGDPQWIPVHWDSAGGNLRFAHIPRDRHGALTFLTDEYISESGAESASAAVADLAAPQSAPPHYVFHSAFCCSTLVARALDAPGAAMGLKEPQILNELAEAARAGTLKRPLLELATALLGRPFAPGESVVVKPSNVANLLGNALLEIRPGSRAIFLYAPLPRFLRSVAAKGMWGRIWARRLFATLTRDTGLDFGLDPAGQFVLTDLQAAALAWLMHHAQAAAMIERFGERVQTLDSDDFLGRRADSLLAISRHFGLPIDEDRAAAIAAGSVFRSHSKEIGRSFDPEGSLEKPEPMVVVEEEVAMIATWARSVAEQCRLPFDLPPGAALLD